MGIRLQTMKKLATEEAKKLKKLLTDKEKGNLNEKYFNSEDIERCIYGQATGNCESERAQELIISCCKRVYDVDNENSADKGKLNGAPTMIDYGRTSKWQSPIELYIYGEHGGDDAAYKIISYLKGETKTLKL